MRVIGLGFVACWVAAGCQREPPVTEIAKKLSPAVETSAAKAAAPSKTEEPTVAVDIEDDEADDKGQGEPMDEVDDVSDKAGAADPPSPPTESGEDPEE
jgi:hypothetical protein